MAVKWKGLSPFKGMQKVSEDLADISKQEGFGSLKPQDTVTLIL